MSEHVLHLEIPTTKVMINGTEFTLREFSAKKFSKWMQVRLNAMNKLESVSKENSNNETLLEEITNGSNEVFKMILGDHVSDDWIEENLTFTLKQALIEEQDRLCKTSDMLGNLQSLFSETNQ
jgi:hypothetical protein